MKTIKQSGFTMLEMMIVMAIIAALIGIGVLMYERQVSKAKLTQTTAFFDRNFFVAVQDCYIKYDSYRSCFHTVDDANSGLATAGIELLTPWETKWYSTISGTQATLIFPLPVGDDEVAEEVRETVEHSESPYIKSATRTAATVTVLFQLP